MIKSAILIAMPVLAAIGIISFLILSPSQDIVIPDSIPEISLSNYAINTKCQLYYKFYDTAWKYDDRQSMIQTFVGYTAEDIGKIMQEAKDKVSQDTKGPNIDPSLLQSEVTQRSMKLFVEKTMSTNSINPKLESDVMEMLQWLNSLNLNNHPLTGNDLEQDIECKNNFEQHFPELL